MIDITTINMRAVRVVSRCVTAIVLSAAIFSACAGRQDMAEGLEEFPIMHPTIADTVIYRQYVADIQSIQNVEIRTRVSGFLEKIHVDEGAFVKAGQRLFSIGDKAFRDEVTKANASLKSAQADAKAAEVEMANTRKLVEGDIVSRSELEMAEAKLEAIHARIEEARSALSTARLNLSFTTVRAPFDGIINRIPNKEGSLINEGTLLTTLSNNEEVFAYFNLSEVEYLQFVRRGDNGNGTVSLIMADHHPYPHPGQIETIEGEINRTTGTIAFRARFPNPEHLLKHGASGKVLLKTAVRDALLVPQRSTFEIQENLYVFVVNNDDVVEMRPVIPRFRLQHAYIIQEGLSASDRLLVEGIQRVRPGDRIDPRPVSAENMNTISRR